MTDPRRELPAVSALLAVAERAGLTVRAPRSLVVRAIRAVVAEAREGTGREPQSGWLGAVERRVAAELRPSLHRVINATGVVLHTNLGRAPLAEAARRAAYQALGYSTLELDPQTGRRGSRQAHAARLLRELTGAEAAFVATNAAAALLLVVNTLAEGGETIVSRGELIEIGGTFRLPEILAKSGTVLTEVGTTNRTRLRDYVLALSPRTRLILKVHRSNFAVRGFVSEAPLAELVAAGRERDLPVVYDVGSGLLVSLERFGLRGEPLVTDAIAAGATVVCSGDKLLGGPQAGIITGPAEVVTRAARNPLARALRPDKVTLAALEATLRLYRDPEGALKAVPVLAMLTADQRELEQRAAQLAARVPAARIEAGSSRVGGGAFPDAALPTALVTVAVRDPDRAVARLRAHEPTVIARVARDRVVLDVRTIGEDELDLVAHAVTQAVSDQRLAES